MLDQRCSDEKLEREWWAYVMLTYARLVGLKSLDHIEPSIGNNVGPMRKMTSSQRDLSTCCQQYCQQHANVGPTNDCYQSENHHGPKFVSCKIFDKLLLTTAVFFFDDVFSLYGIRKTQKPN